MVFEVDKYHNWSSTLTRRFRANTLFSRRIQPSTHSSPIPAIWPSVEVLKNEPRLRREEEWRMIEKNEPRSSWTQIEMT